MTETGQVVDIQENMAHVKFMRTSACGKCKACGMLAHQNEIVVEVEDTLGVQVGERVAVKITSRKALKASAIAYAFPLLMLILGVVLGYLMGDVWHVFENTDMAMALGGLIFAILSFLLLKLAAPLYNKTVRNVYAMVSTEHGKESCADGAAANDQGKGDKDV